MRLIVNAIESTIIANGIGFIIDERAMMILIINELNIRKLPKIALAVPASRGYILRVIAIQFEYMSPTPNTIIHIGAINDKISILII